MRRNSALKELSQKTECTISLGAIESLDKGQKSEGAATRVIDGTF